MNAKAFIFSKISSCELIGCHGTGKTTLLKKKITTALTRVETNDFIIMAFSKMSLSNYKTIHVRKSLFRYAIDCKCAIIDDAEYVTDSELNTIKQMISNHVRVILSYDDTFCKDKFKSLGLKCYTLNENHRCSLKILNSLNMKLNNSQRIGEKPIYIQTDNVTYAIKQLIKENNALNSSRDVKSTLGILENKDIVPQFDNIVSDNVGNEFDVMIIIKTNDELQMYRTITKAKQKIYFLNSNDDPDVILNIPTMKIRNNFGITASNEFVQCIPISECDEDNIRIKLNEMFKLKPNDGMLKKIATSKLTNIHIQFKLTQGRKLEFNYLNYIIVDSIDFYYENIPCIVSSSKNRAAVIANVLNLEYIYMLDFAEGVMSKVFDNPSYKQILDEASEYAFNENYIHCPIIYNFDDKSKCIPNFSVIICKNRKYVSKKYGSNYIILSKNAACKLPI
jgi:hypothetical protein